MTSRLEKFNDLLVHTDVNPNDCFVETKSKGWTVIHPIASFCGAIIQAIQASSLYLGEYVIKFFKSAIV